MFFNTTLRAHRTEAGHYEGGLWVEGMSYDFVLRASVQPTNANDMLLLPEGRRERRAYTLYAAKSLHVADDEAQTNADTVTINNEVYECIHSERWHNGLINHHKMIVTLLHA